MEKLSDNIAPITLAQLIEMIRTVAATEPDFAYVNIRGRCTYSPNPDNACGCIVGEALRELGIDAETLLDIDRFGADGCPVTWGSTRVMECLAGLVSPEALESEWVACVQRRQDCGGSWGGAVQFADELAPDMQWVLA